MSKLIDIKPVEYNSFGTTATVKGFALAEYQNNKALAVIAEVSYGDEEPDDKLMISVNIPGTSEKLPEGHFLLKNYSENEPIAKALIAAGILQPTGETVKSGFVQLPVVKLNCT